MQCSAAQCSAPSDSGKGRARELEGWRTLMSESDEGGRQDSWCPSNFFCRNVNKDYMKKYGHLHRAVLC